MCVLEYGMCMFHVFTYLPAWGEGMLIVCLLPDF